MNAYSNLHGASAPGDDQPTPATLLAELQTAFGRVERCIADLEQLSRGAEPDMVALGNARVRMSQARHSKRRLVHQACELLLRSASVEEMKAIRDIERENFAYFCASTEHVRYWTPETLKSDWVRFCAESRRMRSKMKQLAAVEQHVLLPLLSGHSGSAGV